MTEPNRKPLIGNILAKLDHMANAFNQSAQNKAASDKQTAELLAAAAQALRDEQQKNQALQEELDTIKNAGSLKELKRKNIKKSCFHFLIDGSGSMTGKPIKVALDGVKNFVETTDANVSSAFWGGEFSLRPLPVHQMTSELAERELVWGSNFAPVADYMQVKTLMSKEVQHFVILSDGDIYDINNALPRVRNFLKTSEKSSVDFVIIDACLAPRVISPLMHKFAQQLQQEFPDRVGLRTVSDAQGQSLDEALTLVALERTKKQKTKTSPKPKP